MVSNSRGRVKAFLKNVISDVRAAIIALLVTATLTTVVVLLIPHRALPSWARSWRQTTPIRGYQQGEPEGFMWAEGMLMPAAKTERDNGKTDRQMFVMELFGQADGQLLLAFSADSAARQLSPDNPIEGRVYCGETGAAMWTCQLFGKEFNFLKIVFLDRNQRTQRELWFRADKYGTALDSEKMTPEQRLSRRG